MTPLQQIAAARGAEALDAAEAVSRAYSTAFDPDALALVIVQSGRWAVLVNHPQPPAGFSAAAPMSRRKLRAADPDEPSWSVHITTATRPFEELPHPWLTLEGRPTAVVHFNDVSVATGNAAGWPPAEAVIIHMVRVLWQAHRAAVEPSRALDDMPWLYRADAEDLALGLVEQRLLLATSRLVYNENTQEEYRRLLKSWLAVRKARRAKNPAAVEMEEKIEVREGIADFIQTAPFRVAEAPGAEQRPDLERFDPFFMRYRNFAMLRVNILNYPMNWSPTDPADGLAQARAHGALLAFVAWPVLPKWNEGYFPAGGGMPRSWRELLEPALYKDAPADPNDEAQFVEESRKKEKYDLLVSVIGDAMAEKAQPPIGRPAEAAPALSLKLAGRPLTAWEAAPLWSWKGPGRIEVAGPLLLRFEGGELRLGGGARALFSAPDGGAGAAAGGVGEVFLALEPGAVATLGKKTQPWPGDMRKDLSFQGDGSIVSPGVEVSFRGAAVELGTAGGVVSWPPGK